MDGKEHPILGEQIAYYRARAAEYDEWFLRKGRYDRGPEHRQRWFDEVATVEAALAEAEPLGDVLEIACGTGIWTRLLATKAARLTAVDASSEMIAINEARLQRSNVKYIHADLFQWTPSTAYDFIFFGFWLSHVPADHFARFWHLVRMALRPSGTVFFVDSLPTPESTARDQQIEMDGIVERVLNDGRRFHVVKIFYEPTNLAARLGELGWLSRVKMTPNFFIYGNCRQAGAVP